MKEVFFRNLDWKVVVELQEGSSEFSDVSGIKALDANDGLRSCDQTSGL